MCCALFPAARFNRFFFFWLSMGRRWAIRTLNSKEVSYESGTLHNHCSDKLELNSKDNSEYALLCSLLRRSTEFWLSMGRRWAITTLNFKEVSYESGNLHNYCSDNFEPNSKDNSEYAVLCSLLRGSTVFFFWLSMGRRSSIRTLNLKKSAMEVLFCTIIVVITSNLIRKISLNMLCSVPCCEVQQIFFSGSPW